MKIGTYSPSTEFCGNYYYYSMKLNRDSLMTVGYDNIYNFFKYSNTNITSTMEDEYTKIEYKSNRDDDYYFCLASDCKYICDIDELDYRGNWGIYGEICFRKGCNYDNEFNKAYNMAYNDVKNYNPNTSNLRRSLLEENKAATSTKGYYYENTDYDGYNGYKGYFVIDNELTIIKQTDVDYQEYVEQLKLILNVDETTNSVRIEDITDSDIDQIKSGVEPRYEDGYSDELCKSFIPLKDINDPKYQSCSINIDYLTQDYKNKEYNVSESGSEMTLKIHDTEYDYNEDEIITLKEYDSTKLREIINKITKFTKPIPDNKCLKVNETETNSELVSSLYNKVFYTNHYIVDRDKGEMMYLFRFTPKKDNYYDTDDYSVNDHRSYIDIGNNQFLMANGEVYYHKYVEYKGEEYVGCNEQVKNDAIQLFHNTVNEIMKDIGIEDGSVEYMMKIFLISLLLIIFI